MPVDTLYNESILVDTNDPTQIELFKGLDFGIGFASRFIKRTYSVGEYIFGGNEASRDYWANGIKKIVFVRRGEASIYILAQVAKTEEREEIFIHRYPAPAFVGEMEMFLPSNALAFHPPVAVRTFASNTETLEITHDDFRELLSGQHGIALRDRLLRLSHLTTLRQTNFQSEMARRTRAKRLIYLIYDRACSEKPDKSGWIVYRISCSEVNAVTYSKGTSESLLHYMRTVANSLSKNYKGCQIRITKTKLNLGDGAIIEVEASSLERIREASLPKQDFTWTGER